MNRTFSVLLGKLKSRRGAYLAWGLFLTWFLFLWYLSSSPPEEIQGPDLFPHADKVLHCGYFFVGAFFLYASLLSSGGLAPSMLLSIVVVISMALIGVLDEYHQTYTPGRSGNDLGDWLADTSGGILAVIFCSWGLRCVKTAETSSYE